MKKIFRLFLFGFICFYGLSAHADNAPIGATDYGPWTSTPESENISVHIKCAGQDVSNGKYSWVLQFHNNASQNVSFLCMIDEPNVTSEPPPDTPGHSQIMANGRGWFYGGAKAGQDSEEYYGFGETVNSKSCKVFLNNIQFGNGSQTTNATASQQPQAAPVTVSPPGISSNPKIQAIQNETAAGTAAIQGIGGIIQGQINEKRQEQINQAAEADAAAKERIAKYNAETPAPDSGVTTSGQTISTPNASSLAANSQTPDSAKAWIISNLNQSCSFTVEQRSQVADPSSMERLNTTPSTTRYNITFQISDAKFDGNILRFTQNSTFYQVNVHVRSTGVEDRDDYTSNFTNQFSIPFDDIDPQSIKVTSSSINQHNRIDNSEENTMWDVVVTMNTTIVPDNVERAEGMYQQQYGEYYDKAMGAITDGNEAERERDDAQKQILSDKLANFNTSNKEMRFRFKDQKIAGQFAQTIKWLTAAHSAAEQHPQSLQQDTTPQQMQPVDEITALKTQAEQGDAVAQNKLGYIYQHGQGVTQDYSQSVDWFQKAASQGNADGQENLGFMYEHGLGVTQDYTQALDWFQKSASQDDPQAEFNLGVMYYFGRGVTKDVDEARRWNQKAADQGLQAAKDAVSKLNSN